jgi:hypothetical protein
VFAQMFSFTSRSALVAFAIAFGMSRGTEAELSFDIDSISVQSNSCSIHFLSGRANTTMGKDRNRFFPNQCNSAMPRHVRHGD